MSYWIGFFTLPALLALVLTVDYLRTWTPSHYPGNTLSTDGPDGVERVIVGGGQPFWLLNIRHRIRYGKTKNGVSAR